MQTVTVVTFLAQTFVFLLSTRLCVSRDSAPSISQKTTVDSGCKKVAIINDNICNLFKYCDDYSMTVCKLYDTIALVNPRGYLKLHNVKVHYNALTNKHYATFSVQLTSSTILQEIAQQPDYKDTSVLYRKVTHVRFLPSSSDVFGIRNEVELNQQWMPVDAENPTSDTFVVMQFASFKRDIIEQIIDAVRGINDEAPGQIITEAIHMEMKTEEEVLKDNIAAHLTQILILDSQEVKVIIIPKLMSEIHKEYFVPYLPEKQWILMQRRDTPGVDFNRNWKDYKTGFGSWENDFWLGLEKIYQITKDDGGYGLRMEFESHKGLQRSAQWENFRVGSEEENYKLNISGFDTKSSAGEDKMAYSNGRGFATVDRDNAYICAEMYGGGWWFWGCMNCHFNSQLRSSIEQSSTCVHYDNFKGSTHFNECLKRVRMFIIKH